MREIIEQNPGALTPYENNARTHSEEQVARIAESIKSFGFTNPVLVDNSNTIVAGHGRVQAALLLGMTSVPTIFLEGLTEAQVRAYVLADNRLAEDAGWDMELVSSELKALLDLDFDIELTGFDLDDILPEEPAGLTDEDDAPARGDTATCKPGDMWLLGDHRVVCGDATDPRVVEQVTTGELVDLLLTDPPYNVAYEGKTADALTIKNDAMSDEDFRAFLTASLKAADAVMKPGASFYIWHADSEGYNFRGACRDNDWQVRQCIIWNKNVMVLGRQDYHWKHEPCLYGWKGGAGHLWASDRTQTTVLDFARPSRSADHPTMKPVALMQYQVLNNTKGKDVVLDLFGGSGSTLIACENTGRCARLVELDPVYCDVIIQRWQDYTGGTAVLSSTGEVFVRAKT